MGNVAVERAEYLSLKRKEDDHNLKGWASLGVSGAGICVAFGITAFSVSTFPLMPVAAVGLVSVGAAGFMGYHFKKAADTRKEIDQNTPVQIRDWAFLGRGREENGIEPFDARPSVRGKLRKLAKRFVRDEGRGGDVDDYLTGEFGARKDPDRFVLVRISHAKNGSDTPLVANDHCFGDVKGEKEPEHF